MVEVKWTTARRRYQPGPFPRVYLLGAILLMIALHWFFPGVQLFAASWRLAGAAPVAAGLLLNIWADQLFKLAATSVKPFEPSTALVLKGPFSFTRDPMYFGMVLVLVGIPIGLGSATPWLIVPFFVWLIQERFIIPEELKLEAAFADQYHEYKAKVRRWI